METRNILLSLAAAAVLFTGCGGGSSSGGDTTTEPTSTTNTTQVADTQYSVKQAADLKTDASATGSNTMGATTTGDVSATGKTKETLASEITSDLTLTTNKIWVMNGLVTVKDGATLTIPAGTLLAGKSGKGDNTSYLVIDKGSKIMAQGTAANPIVFTSETVVDGGNAAAGQWGGVTLIGKAGNDQVGAYEANTNFVPENSDLADNSGVMTHVKILNTGIAIRENEEVNGLSFVGVGSGTTISDITVENASDDGVELWGGTVNLSNITIVNALDDSFDIDDGFSGTVTNLKIDNSEGKAGIEMSGTTVATFDGFNITTGQDQAKEGGIYFKKDGIGGHFKNGTITHNATNDNGALYSAGTADADNISFSNVVLTGSSEYKITENAVGASAEVLHAKFNGQK
jgi:hypothetical protein